MPVLGASLYNQAGRFPQRRIPVRIMKEIMRQLLTGLAFLHDACKVVHTDLHPANIYLEIGEEAVEDLAAGKSAEEVTATVSETHPGRVRIIDFGVASWVDEHLTDHIQREHLRAPEVVLGAPWGPPVDIWSLGCLIVEFVMGHQFCKPAPSKKGTWNKMDDLLAQQIDFLGRCPQIC
jgi:serine/threonine-protein kinase SRPK3